MLRGNYGDRNGEMKSRTDDSIAAVRLTGTVSAHEDPDKRTDALAKFVSGYEPDAMGPILGSVVKDACSSLEAGLTFLSLLDRGRLEQSSPEWDWAGLDHYFLKTRLDDVWKLFGRLGPQEREYAAAKISMLIEIAYLLIEDDLLDPDSDAECTGADMALNVLNARGSGQPEFQIMLSSYPVSIRKFMKDILSELDFIEKSPGLWQFTITKDSLSRYTSGGNLASHLGSGAISQAVAQRNAENLVKRLELLLKAMQMFPAGHPSIDPSCESLLSVLSKLRGEKDQVTLSVMGDTIMVNDVRVEKRTSGMSSFIRSFTERRMSSLSFSPGITQEELKTFARIFNRPAVYISEHGGMARLLEARGLNTLAVNRFHYQLVSEDGKEQSNLDRGEVSIEDAIFAELIDRLERGDSIDSLPGQKIGDALKSVLAAARSDREEQRGMIARFVTALDPTLLERGILSNPAIQRSMAWKAVRRIIDGLLANLMSPDPDVRHDCLGKLREMVLLAVERGKENSTIQVIESVSMMLKREQDPDVYYRAVVLTASLMESLLARGMMSIALTAGKVLQNVEGTRFPRTELEAARKRSLVEAHRKMDTIESADAIVQRLLSEDESVSREAQRLAMIAPPDNLVSQLVSVFNEDNRRLRSKAFQMLLRMGKRGLESLHKRLREVTVAFEPHMNDSSFSLPERDWYIARNMIQVLREIGAAESESVLADLCRVPDPRVRRECLLALARVSQTTAESLSLHLVLDRSVEVSGIALDILTKQASNNPAFIPRIIEAFRKNPGIRTGIMESFSILGKHGQVIDFISQCLQKGPTGILFENPELIAGSFRIMRRYGNRGMLPLLENLRDEVEGGFLKKSKIDRELVSLLRETIEALQLGDSVIAGGDAVSMPGSGRRKTRRSGESVRSTGEDEITILGPDYGIGD